MKGEKVVDSGVINMGNDGELELHTDFDVDSYSSVFSKDLAKSVDFAGL